MARKNLKDLARLMRRVKKRIPGVGDDYVKSASRAVLKTVVRKTPVDTSAAISNWQVSVNTPVGPPPIEAHFLGKRGSTRVPSSAESVARGFQKISSKKPKGFVRVSNKISYIGILDGGTSRRPGANFAGAAKLEASTKVKRTKVYLTK